MAIEILALQADAAHGREVVAAVEAVKAELCVGVPRLGTSEQVV